MKRTRLGHSQYSAEQRAALVAQFRASGETQQRFAQRHGIKWTTFRNWLYGSAKVSPAPKPTVQFQEIESGPLVLSHPWAAEIGLSGGTMIRVRAGVDPQWICAIVQPLQRPC